MDIHELVQNVIDGQESPLLALAILREEKKQVDKCIKEIEEQAMTEAENFQEKSFTHKGFSFEKRVGGRTFIFKGIPDWQMKKSELDAIEDRAKQAFISKEKGLMTASQDGEVIDLPEVSYKKDNLVIKQIKL